MAMFKSVVLKKVIQKPGMSGPLYCRIHLDGKKTDSYLPGNEILGHVTVIYNEEFSYCGKQKILTTLTLVDLS